MSSSALSSPSDSVPRSAISSRLDFTPEEGRYDVIWIQWCIGQLPDDDFISFFNRAKVGLKPDGFFVLKENNARNGFVLDKVDNSVTRSDAYFRELFKKCGLYIHSIKDQKDLPKELFAVKMRPSYRSDIGKAAICGLLAAYSIAY